MFKGEEGKPVVQEVCLALQQMLKDVKVEKDIVFQSAVDEVRTIALAMSVLSAPLETVHSQAGLDALETVMSASLGVSLMVAQTVETVRAYGDQRAVILQQASATAEHAPKLEEALALCKESPTLVSVKQAMQSYPLWRDALPKGF